MEWVGESVSPVQVIPLSLLTYPETQMHLNDPSVFLHSECGLFLQVWLPVAHSSISERYDQMQILMVIKRSGPECSKDGHR